MEPMPLDSKLEGASSGSVGGVPPRRPGALVMAERSKSRGRLGRAAIQHVGYPLAFLLVCVVLWQLIVPWAGVKRELVPVPTEIFDALVEHRATVLKHTWPTLYEILAGFTIAVLLGVIIGSLVVPKIALAPLFVIWFGFGYTPKIIVVVLVCFFPVVVDTALGLASVPPEMRQLGRSMGASPLRFFWRVSLPYALPNVLVGMKVAMALATVGAIVAEFVQSSQGLGYLLLVSNQNLETPLFFAAMLVLTMLGVVLYAALDLVEHVALRSRRV
jgi:NitT/TauT family transport system permease protein